MISAAPINMPLEVSDLRVTNPRGRILLQVDHLHAATGETLGIRGPSGAGKSTLLFALAGLIGNCTGTIIWGNNRLLSQSITARAAFRASHIGMIFQDFLLFDELSAAANAALTGLFRPPKTRPAINKRATDLLSNLGIARDPRPVASYSGGERQRVAIARALAHDPDILLADEPTANLDRAAADALINDLIHLTHDTGKTLIAVSHDQALLDRMDRIITITNGRVEAAHV